MVPGECVHVCVCACVRVCVCVFMRVTVDVCVRALAHLFCGVHFSARVWKCVKFVLQCTWNFPTPPDSPTFSAGFGASQIYLNSPPGGRKQNQSAKRKPDQNEVILIESDDDDKASDSGAPVCKIGG